MRLVLSLCYLATFLIGCTGRNNSSTTCEFEYYSDKKIKSVIDLTKNIDSSFNYLDYHEIVNGKGNIAKCVKKHIDSKITDKIWYEVITIYYPEIHEKLEFGSNKNNLLVYSAFGGIAGKKNYCYGYAKRGEAQLVSNKINFINVELDFIGKEKEKVFCKKEFGNVLTQWDGHLSPIGIEPAR